jgi:hypothetical protein
MAEEIKVTADPTPDPTPEEAARLRRQLEANRASFELAGKAEDVAAIDERLAGLPAEDVAVVEEEVEEEDTGTGTYEERSLEQLRALARSKGVASSGTKADIIERLRA